MRLSLPLLLLATLCACAPAGVRPAPVVPMMRDSLAQLEGIADRLGLPTDTLLRTGRLANGLTYYVRPDEQEQGRAELRLVVRAGTVLEDADQRGLAHFLEHMAFNGTRRFPRDQIVAWLERLGMRFGPDVNAYTNYDETVYRLTVPTDGDALERGVQVLEDWASSITLDSAQIARERGVVVEEWRAGLGAGARIVEREHDFVWAGSPYAGRRVVGDPETLQRFDPASLERFYRDWYRPDLMAVVAVGDFDGARVEQMVRDAFGALPTAENPRPRPEPAPPLGHGSRYLVTTDPELSLTRLDVCWLRPAVPLLTARDRVDHLGMWMVVSMLNRRLEEAARQPGAAFAGARVVPGAPVRPVRQLCLVGLAPEGGSEAALAALLAEVERVARDGFTEAELRREQEERRASVRHQAESRATASEAADTYVQAFLDGEPPVLSPEQARFRTLGILPVTLRAANGLARAWLRAPDRVVLLNAPERAQAPPPGEARLAGIADSVAAAPVSPYAARAQAAPAPVRGPRPGRVLAEEYTPGIGVVRWTLSNGARVVLRRWGGDDRGVRLLAVSRGGLSLVPDSLFAEALAAPLVVSSGGAGELSAPELERLSGGEVELSFYVDAAGEGISGNAEPGRLKDLLRMVHLHFTAPRLDTAAWNVTVRRLQSAFSGRSNDPAQVFADTLSALLGTDDPRLPSVTPESLPRVDPVRAVQVFRERFADASDFTFYLAGEMEPEQVRPWVERYLASLPGAGVREVPRDLGARPPAGVAVRTVRAGRAEAGAVAIVFSGEAKHSREARGELEGLAEVLQHRLHARLRDELGLVYEQDVTWWMGNVPVPSYQVTVFIPAAPERLQEVTRIVFESVDSLRAHGGSPDEVLRVREAARRAYEDGRSSNGFWVNALREADENGWDAGDASLPSSATRLTRRRVAEAARRYLNPRQYVQVMLLPADVPPPAPPKPEAGSPRD